MFFNIVNLKKMKVEKTVNNYFSGCKVAESKSPFRIKQKYEEYCKGYLSEGIHAYKKFKDLFRGSISIEDYLEAINNRTEVLNISSINYREDGNYRAAYVILNVDSLNFELKIVKNVQNSIESHDWYELKRNDSIENLDEFIRKEIQGRQEF